MAKVVRLMTYDTTQQQYGTWFAGFDWNIYGTGTYREPVSESRAQVLLKRYMERLGRKMHGPVSYVGALEGRPSGLDPAIPRHWHFLASCRHPEGMHDVAKELWNRYFGNAKVEAYDPSRDAAFYIAKLAGHHNGHLALDNLDLLQYNGQSDLVAVAKINPYVPDHLKERTSGQFLVVR